VNIKPQRAIEVVLSAAFLVVFAVTLHSNWKLRRSVADMTAALHAKSSLVALRPGDPIPPFDATNPAGQVVQLPRSAPANARESYLVVIDPACESCKRAVAEVNASRRDDVTVVALLRREIKSPMPEIRTGVPVFTVERSAAPQFAQRIDAVPRILRVAADGRIRAVCGSLTACSGV